MLIIGIDPGASGGIAFRSGSAVWIHKTPETNRDILDLLQTHSSGEECFAYVEWIHPAIQGIGKSSMSKLYGSFKELMMALDASAIPYEDVKPQVWQKCFSLVRPKADQNKWKNMLKAKAQQLFPSLTITKDTADALLIAEYGRRLRAGEFSK